MRARAFARRNIKELFRDPLALFFGLGFPLSVPAHRLPHDGGGLPAGLPSAHAPRWFPRCDGYFFPNLPPPFRKAPLEIPACL